MLPGSGLVSLRGSQKDSCAQAAFIALLQPMIDGEGGCKLPRYCWHLGCILPRVPAISLRAGAVPVDEVAMGVPPPPEELPLPPGVSHKVR